jgi:hypothetical protein
MVNYIEPNFQDIIFEPIRVGLITQKQFWDHLKNCHSWGWTPYHYLMVSAAAVKLYHGDQHDDNLLSCWEVARKSLGEKKQVVTRLVVTV